MDKLCKDISKINYFQPVSLSLHVRDSSELCCNKAYLQTIQKIRAGVKHFKKSTFATAHLRIQRRQLQIKRGLVSVGKTRFGTLYHSGDSVRRNLKPIRQLCTNKLIYIKVSDSVCGVVDALTNKEDITEIQPTFY
jgi:hypothetical protein